ncbi:MAG: exosortase/archaeosortase family protein, partial [Phycisphaerae bacterium]
SSLFLGSQCLPVHEGYLLLRSSIPIRVTQACNAASFFILTLSLFVGLAVKYRKQTSRFIIFSIPLLAYPVTIIANSVRIIAGAYITNWTRAALPENFWPSIHLAVGITVFLTFLTICYLLIAWRLNNAARI